VVFSTTPYISFIIFACPIPHSEGGGLGAQVHSIAAGGGAQDAHHRRHWRSYRPTGEVLLLLWWWWSSYVK